MKKSKILAIILAVAIISTAVLPLTVSATSEAFDNLPAASKGKKPLLYPEFIDGGEGFNEREHSYSMFVYDEYEDNGEFPKYCTNKSPYWAEWKYDKAYAVERIILRTANDNEQYLRRMGDGWTLSGSNDGKSWTVIYTGKEDDVLNTNFRYYFVDLPDNKTEYQYYRLHSDKKASDQPDFIVQLSMFILCVNPSVNVPTGAKWKPKEFKLGTNKTIIPAIDFDSGKYYESNGADGNHECRPEEEVQTEVGESEFGGNIGWTAAGEWVQYTVNVQRDGVYRFDAWLASAATSAGNIEISVGDKIIGQTKSSDTDGWQAYSLYPVGDIALTNGATIIKVEFIDGNTNLGALEITRVGDIGGNSPANPIANPVGQDNALAEDNAADDNPAAAENSSSAEEEIEIDIILILILGAAILLVIVVIIVIVTKNRR